MKKGSNPPPNFKKPPPPPAPPSPGVQRELPGYIADWVSVDNVMPKQYQNVLFLEPFTESIDGTRHLGYYDGKNWLTGETEEVVEVVTHWIGFTSSAKVIDDMQRAI